MNTVIIVLSLTVIFGIYLYVNKQNTVNHSITESKNQDSDFTNGDCSDYHGMGHA